MAQARINRIAAGYSEIKRLIESESYSKVIKTVNKVLNDDHNQPEAWKCKVVAYMQMDQFKEAVSTIAKAPNKLQMQFELAYCQYRLNDVSAALASLDAAPDKDSTRGKELRAQILYRLERHNDCYTVYRELLRNTADDMDMERRTNMAAVQVHRAMQGQGDVPAAPDKTASYEQWYNSGCIAVAAGDTQEALSRLTQSLKQCRILLEDEGSPEEEVQQEQAIIRVQQGYVLQMEGRDKEAGAEYSSVLQHKVEDPALLAIVHNNMAAINKDANVFDTRKKMKATQVPELEHKLNRAQKDELALNNSILAYHSQQLQQEEPSIVAECNKLLSSPSTSQNVRMRALLLLAASLAKAGQLEEAVKRLHQWGQDNKNHARMIRLAATQLRLMKSDVSGGVSELTQLPPADRYRAGVVGSIVTLLTSKKQKQQVAQIFKEAAAWHQENKDTSSPESVEQLLRRAADFHLKEGDPRSAAAALEQLRKNGGRAADTCLPSLIHAYSQFDSAKAQQLSKELPEPTESGTGAPLDADVLEASLGPKYFLKVAQKLDEGVASQVEKPSSGRVKPRKKKVRKTVLPKSYIEGVTPDPERWLPRWQRKTTGGRKRRDRKKEKDVGRGTQGGTGDAADKYDITKNPGQYKGSSVQPQQPEPAGPRRNMPKKKTGKKK